MRSSPKMLKCWILTPGPPRTFDTQWRVYHSRFRGAHWASAQYDSASEGFHTWYCREVSTRLQDLLTINRVLPNLHFSFSFFFAITFSLSTPPILLERFHHTLLSSAWSSYKNPRFDTVELTKGHQRSVTTHHHLLPTHKLYTQQQLPSCLTASLLSMPLTR